MGQESARKDSEPAEARSPGSSRFKIDESHDSMAELRSIILKQERRELTDAQNRLRILESKTGELRVERLSELLPEAVANRSKKDNKLASALAPSVEETLKLSVKRNPQPLVDAIFPIIGPAIRKSIQEALTSATEAMNSKMNSAFSIQSIKWRMEARRSGLSYAEIVMRDTLLYRVEQIFLIDVATGLPLQHVSQEAVDVQDGTLVSSMLTAIQDFVEDSFGAAEGESVGTLEVGDLTVWIESGPRATLAAVIRGMPPRALRQELREIVEAVHLYFGDELSSFDGDSTEFERARPLLEAALTEELQQTSSKPSIALRLLGILLLLALIASAIFLWQRGRQWDRFVHALDAEPGIVVTGLDKDNGRRIVRGLLDPMANAPSTILASFPINPERVSFEWEGYTTLDPEIIVKRAEQLLDPPPTVTFASENGVLFASGAASPEWIASARDRALSAGNLGLYDDAALVNIETVAYLDLVDAVGGFLVRFEGGSASFIEGEERRLDGIAQSLMTLWTLANNASNSVRVTLSGHASLEGTADINNRLSQRRAESVRAALVSRGVPASMLATRATGGPWNSSLEDEFNRSVSFQVSRAN